MKTKTLLSSYLTIIIIISFLAFVFPNFLTQFILKNSLYKHILFIHILSATLFFSNAVVGTLWEWHSLLSKRSEVILHTYNTVSWLDLRFSLLMILVSLSSGILLTLLMGDIKEISWLFYSFLLFILSGVIWLIGDITTQYKIRKLVKNISPDTKPLPTELTKLLKMRICISLADVAPLLIIFYLMVYKPTFT